MEAKEAILETTYRLVQSFGVRIISMDEIARKTGVSKKTIYEYYANKAELVLACTLKITDDLKSKVDQTCASSINPVVKVADIYAVCLKVALTFPNNFFYELKKMYPNANDVLDEFREDTVYKSVVKMLHEAQKQGLLREEVDIKLVGKLFFNRIQDVIDSMDIRHTHSFGQIFDHLILFKLRGLLKPESVHLLEQYVLPR